MIMFHVNLVGCNSPKTVQLRLELGTVVLCSIIHKSVYTSIVPPRQKIADPFLAYHDSLRSLIENKSLFSNLILKIHAIK